MKSIREDLSEIEVHSIEAEETPLLASNKDAASPPLCKEYPQEPSSGGAKPSILRRMSNHIIPSRWETIDTLRLRHAKPDLDRKQICSIRRGIFLFLTEPETSIASAGFFALLVVAISVMNMVMIMQTMKTWQFVPTDCRSCGGRMSYLFDDDDSIIIDSLITGKECECPPTPLLWTGVVLKWLVYFFTVEWILRVLTFEPPLPEQATSCWGSFFQWFAFLTSTSTLLDALSIFPYYVEMSFQTNGLMSLRLLRLFRVFQLVRLGQYNEHFSLFTAVLVQSIPYLRLLLGVLVFGAAFFGSMMYWLEKGDWKYDEATDSFAFMRVNAQGQDELSPFTSIPASFWWFFVTATTVGYGDIYPTTMAGKWVATFAMLTGVLVVAFPVSVFSSLWSKELRKTGAFEALEDDDDGNADTDAAGSSSSSPPNSLDQTLAPNGPSASPAQHRGLLSTESERSSTAEEGGRKFHRAHGDFVELHKDDLAEIITLAQTIAEAQRDLKAILRKYALAP